MDNKQLRCRRFTDFAAAQAGPMLQQSFERVASVRLVFGGA